MGFCDGGFPSSTFFENLTQAVTVVRDGHLINGMDGVSYAANTEANYLTGYFSDQAKCNLSPGALPGHWKTPLVWESYCHGVGVKRELTQIELFGNACGNGAANFCESLTDQGGNKRKPLICGGTDPNIFVYNPSNVAVSEVQGEFQNMQADAEEIASDLIMEQRKKIFAIALIIVVVIVLLFMLFKK